MSEELRKKIKEATVSSLKHRDLYDAQVSAELTKALKDVQEKVAKAILKYKAFGNLSDKKVASLTGLEKLNKEIATLLTDLKKHQRSVFINGVEGAYKLGINASLNELVALTLPFYKDLGKTEIDKITTKVFTQIDRSALDFLSQYSITLSDDVGTEALEGIKKVLMRSIIDGKGTDDIVRELGRVVQFKDSFKKAGSKVFSKAQYRLEMIARTEIARAHNQGRNKFFNEVGVQKLEWMTMDDERTCSVCGPLNEKVFDLDKFPPIPAHPFCRCMGILGSQNFDVKVPGEFS